MPRSLYAFAVLAFAGLLFWAGAQPIAVGLFPPPYDILAHFVAFSVLAVLIWRALGDRLPWLAVVGVGLVGAMDEVHQFWLPGRDPTMKDWLMDVVAAIVTIAVLMLWRARRASK